jgi:hypothetical protein
MDGNHFDRIVKTLADRAPRRETIKALAGGGLLAAAGGLDASAKRKKNKHKKKERKIGQTCGGRKKCSKKQGPVACQPFPSPLCEGVDLTGNRCCGLEGTICDPNFGTPLEPTPVTGVGNCSCCDPLFCAEQTDGSFRCQIEPT